ncbi:MAG: carboxypeptidase regulatory-like domain-containing protein, partial [Bryobacteraceae bacterium]|nr:carboxypeptidase regulatory-like domain-containing protein [Bryobacteraceae bacterium]
MRWSHLSALALLSAAQLLAQPKAQISGFVRDSSTAIVQQAAISILNLDTGIRRSTVSNSEGFYAVSSLTAGQYKVTVRKSGFTTIAQTGIALHAMDSGRLDFTLDISSVREEITVGSIPQLFNTSDASSGLISTRDPAEALPINGRGLQGLIDLAPGVLTTPATAGEAGQFSANGQRPATNYFTVDGVSANNGVSGSGLPGQFSGAALPAMTAIGSLHNLVSLGELDELRVQTSTYAPEYGRLPGAQVAVTTRSGSNEFRGEIFGSIRHEKASANDWFANAAGLSALPQRLTDAGGTVGGPVLRNRTFFLLSSEQLRLRQPVTFLIPVPSLQARERAPESVRALLQAFPLPDGPEAGAGISLHTARTSYPADVGTTSFRLDQAIPDSGILFFRYNYSPSSNSAGYLQRNQASFHSHTGTFGIITAMGPRFTNDLRIGTTRTSARSEWLPGAAAIDLRSFFPSPGLPAPGLPSEGQDQNLYAIGIRGFGQIIAGDPGESRQTTW